MASNSKKTNSRLRVNLIDVGMFRDKEPVVYFCFVWGHSGSTSLATVENENEALWHLREATTRTVAASTGSGEVLPLCANKPPAPRLVGFWPGSAQSGRRCLDCFTGRGIFVNFLLQTTSSNAAIARAASCAHTHLLGASVTCSCFSGRVQHSLLGPWGPRQSC